ncbi:MAG TPA: hypothetical protein VJX71_13435 [Methylomirabilota bacterium]|nr:hypothetical protein [Methylomirabilota bacterium]
MDRRTFVGVLAGGLLAAPCTVRAQPADKIPLVGILDNGVPRLFTAFREGLRGGPISFKGSPPTWWPSSPRSS